MDYLNVKNDIVNKLRLILIESFVDFYGENYRYKIAKLINDVIVVSVARNETDDIINRKLSILSKREQNIEEIIRIEYYQELKNKKENDTDNYVFMTSTDDNRLEYLKQQVKNKDVKCSGWVIPKQDDPMIFIVGIKNNITTIIHEINHLLTEEVLGKKYDDEGNYIESVRTHGIHSKGFTPDLVYEIINELITQEIFEILMNKHFSNFPSEYHHLITYQKSNKYLTLDACSFDIVKSIYERMESIIKSRLITGSGSTIQKIIGELNYDELRMFLLENKRNLEKYMRNHDDVLGYIDSLSPKVIFEYQRIKSNIENSYDEYLEYMVNLNSYVDKLVSDNKGRRVN